MKIKTALVTGATGFIASHLVQRLVKDGWEVHIIIRPSSSLKQIQSVKNDIKIHTHDATTEGMFAIVQEAQPKIVFHLASLFLAHHKPSDILPLLQSNLMFATQLVEAMVIHQVHALVNTGTFWQHYQNQNYSPVCLYAATKQAFESILQYYIEATPLKAITLKLFDTYGPNDPRQKLFAQLKNTAMQQETLAMSLGEQLLDLVYIDDVIDAYCIAAQRLETEQVQGHEQYAVSTGIPLRLQEVVKIYEQQTHLRIPISWGSRPYRLREVMEVWDKGETLPGWKAKVNLEDGIKKILLND